MEVTLVLLKPDCVKRGLMGEVISRIEKKGLRIIGMKMMSINREIAERHYAVHTGKPFFERLIKFITSAPLVAIAVSGRSSVNAMRKMLGATHGLSAASGTIRGDFCMDITRNLVHASDSVESAEYELPIFFDESELHNISQGR